MEYSNDAGGHVAGDPPLRLTRGYELGIMGGSGVSSVLCSAEVCRS